jgi:hypothetical protein
VTVQSAVTSPSRCLREPSPTREQTGRAVDVSVRWSRPSSISSSSAQRGSESSMQRCVERTSALVYRAVVEWRPVLGLSAWQPIDVEDNRTRAGCRVPSEGNSVGGLIESAVSVMLGEK